MENKIYRLGAVVKSADTLYLIVGYDFIEVEDHLKLVYKTVPFPQGYTGITKLVQVDSVELVKEGHIGDISDKIYAFFKRCAEVSQKLTAEEMKPYLKMFYYGITEVK